MAGLPPSPPLATAPAAGLQAGTSQADLSALAGRLPSHRSTAASDGDPPLPDYLNMVGSARNGAAAAAVPVPAAAPTTSGPMLSLASPTFSPHKRNDPLYVLDLNTSETIPANVTLHTFSSWGENLLAQVSGVTVSTWSWNVANAPDLTNVSGTATANLQGTWASFTGAARTDTITVTETPTNGPPLSQTLTFRVAGTNSPAYAATRPTTSATWASALTPDLLTAQQATVTAGPYASLGLADGSVQTSFAMPTYNPAPPPAGMVHPPS